jgi:CheY-like chemotaxis protein
MMTLSEPEVVRPIEVLLVEDDEGDVLITREALHEGMVQNRLNVVGDGVEAVAYLRRDTPYADARRPDLILLDLNLPKRDGRQVLADIKGDADLRRIPVVVLSTSAAQEDIVRSYDLHANAYVTKPVDFDRFVTVIRQIDDFFISVATLPPE